MSYVTAAECIEHRKEPCAEVSSCDLQTAIDDAERNVNNYLKTLGVDTVPLTEDDITEDFKKAVYTWVAAEIYYQNNQYEEGDVRKNNAKDALKIFVKSHDWAGTTTSVPTSYAQGYQYTGSEIDLVSDDKEPRDV